MDQGISIEKLVAIALGAFLSFAAWHLGLSALRAAEDGKRAFHPRTIAQITEEDPVDWKHPLTHVQTEGWLTYKAHEDDGDWHLRLCDSARLQKMDAKRCVVAEIIPELPLEVPKMGAHVRVQGIYRWDGENPGHHWAEVHPVLHIEVIGEETGKLAPLPEPKWVADEYSDGHWSCPEGFREPEVKSAGWRCEPDGEAH